MTPRPPHAPPALFFRRASDAVLRLLPIMAAVSMALWPKHAPTLVFCLLGVCVMLCGANVLARRSATGARP